jgi:hypothetical protein
MKHITSMFALLLLVSTMVLLAQTPKPAPAHSPTSQSRTEKGLYQINLVEPGYDVAAKEIERAPTYSMVEIQGLVPTMTAGGVVLFKVAHDIAKERGSEYVFILPAKSGQGAAVRTEQGRRVSLVTKIFMVKDKNVGLKDLLGADYSEDAQQMFNMGGYRSVAELAKLVGGNQP